MFQIVLIPGHTDKNKKLQTEPISAIFRQRLDCAIKLLEEGLPPAAIIVSGKGPRNVSEAEAGVQYLREKMLGSRILQREDSTRLLREDSSMETIGNYIFSDAAFIRPLRANRVVTVTSPDQANRCHKIAARIWGSRVDHSVYVSLPAECLPP